MYVCAFGEVGRHARQPSEAGGRGQEIERCVSSLMHHAVIRVALSAEHHKVVPTFVPL